MPKVIVLGGSGMLGSMVVDVLARDRACSVTATARDPSWASRTHIPRVTWATWSWHALEDPAVIDGHDWVVNCIGITKPHIRDDKPVDVERAVRVNALFPFVLAKRAADTGARIIQIATDCVYSGNRGRYCETDPHDPLDVYGKTKSLGEVWCDHVHHLRCSVIGPEPKDFKFLLEWLRHQPRGTQLAGFRNHLWNGVTTLAFARLCLGIVKMEPTLPPVQHLIPADMMTKAEMLQMFARVYHREDLVITDVDATTEINRTLATNASDINATLWRNAGYDSPPTVSEMIEELSAFDYRFI